MKVIFVFILLSVLITRSMAYNVKCNVDECVLSVDCPMLMKVLNKNTLNLDDVEFLNSRICSESNGQILVCCKEKQTIKEPERIIETTTSVPTTLHCGDSGFSSMLGGTKTSIDEFPWTALIQYTYRKFFDFVQSFELL